MRFSFLHHSSPPLEHKRLSPVTPTKPIMEILDEKGACSAPSTSSTPWSCCWCWPSSLRAPPSFSEGTIPRPTTPTNWISRAPTPPSIWAHPARVHRRTAQRRRHVLAGRERQPHRHGRTPRTTVQRRRGGAPPRSTRRRCDERVVPVRRRTAAARTRTPGRHRPVPGERRRDGDR